MNVAVSYDAGTPRRRWFVPALAVAAVLACFTPASAEPERVVLAGLPEPLAHATDTVLVPWRIEIVRLPEIPAADPSRARREVEALATRARAGAVVWLATDEPPTLWLYDAASRQTLSRPLPSAPPYDDPTAASVALSIKTLLRHSSVAPPAERVPLPLPPPAAQPRSFTAEARALLRLSHASPGGASFEPRAGVGLTWWPAFLSARYGVGLEAELGPGQTVQKSGFRGRLYDLTAVLAVRRDIALRGFGERLSAVPMLGVGLHVTRFAGEQQPMRLPVRIGRLVPSVIAGVAVHARVGRITRIGATLHGALMTRAQDYESMDRTIVGAPAFAAGAGLVLLVSL